MCMYMRKNRKPETYSVLWFLLGCLAEGEPDQLRQTLAAPAD